MSDIQTILSELDKLSAEKLPSTRKLFKRLKKRTPKQLDLVMQELHEAEFESTNCLDCANCCKTTSPIFTEMDIKRAAKFLRVKEAKFVEDYLRRDSDEFMVLKAAPCPFLDHDDNRCFIYDARPRACKEYPHTNRRKFIQITELTIKNTAICPAAYNIVEALKKKYP